MPGLTKKEQDQIAKLFKYKEFFKAFAEEPALLKAWFADRKSQQDLVDYNRIIKFQQEQNETFPNLYQKVYQDFSSEGSANPPVSLDDLRKFFKSNTEFKNIFLDDTAKIFWSKSFYSRFIALAEAWMQENNTIVPGLLIEILNSYRVQYGLTNWVDPIS